MDNIEYNNVLVYGQRIITENKQMHYLYFRFESGFQIVLVQVKYSISDTALSWFRRLDKQKKK